MNNYKCECGGHYKAVGTAMFCEYGAFEIFFAPNPEVVVPAKITWVGGGFCGRCAVLAAQHVVQNGYKEDGIYYFMTKHGGVAATYDGRIAAIPPFQRVKVVGVNRWRCGEGGDIITPTVTDYSDIRVFSGGVELHPEEWDRLGVGGRFCCALLYKQTGRLYTNIRDVRFLLSVQEREADRVKHALWEDGVTDTAGVWMRRLRVMMVYEDKEPTLLMAGDIK